MSDDWQVVEEGLNGSVADARKAHVALARLREREAQLNEEGHALRGSEVALEKRIRGLEEALREILHRQAGEVGTRIPEIARRALAHEEPIMHVAEREAILRGPDAPAAPVAHEEEK